MCNQTQSMDEDMDVWHWVETPGLHLSPFSPDTWQAGAVPMSPAITGHSVGPRATDPETPWEASLQRSTSSLLAAYQSKLGQVKQSSLGMGMGTSQRMAVEGLEKRPTWTAGSGSGVQGQGHTADSGAGTTASLDWGGEHSWTPMKEGLQTDTPRGRRLGEKHGGRAWATATQSEETHPRSTIQMSQSQTSHVWSEERSQGKTGALSSRGVEAEADTGSEVAEAALMSLLLQWQAAGEGRLDLADQGGKVSAFTSRTKTGGNTCGSPYSASLWDDATLEPLRATTDGACRGKEGKEHPRKGWSTNTATHGRPGVQPEDAFFDSCNKGGAAVVPPHLMPLSSGTNATPQVTSPGSRPKAQWLPRAMPSHPGPGLGSQTSGTADPSLGGALEHDSLLFPEAGRKLRQQLLLAASLRQRGSPLGRFPGPPAVPLGPAPSSVTISSPLGMKRSVSSEDSGLSSAPNPNPFLANTKRLRAAGLPVGQGGGLYGDKGRGGMKSGTSSVLGNYAGMAGPADIPGLDIPGPGPSQRMLSGWRGEQLSWAECSDMLTGKKDRPTGPPLLRHNSMSSTTFAERLQLNNEPTLGRSHSAPAGTFLGLPPQQNVESQLHELQPDGPQPMSAVHLNLHDFIRRHFLRSQPGGPRRVALPPRDLILIEGILSVTMVM